jgi:uncharacterized protein (DUF4213/DUF364 family)
MPLPGLQFRKSVLMKLNRHLYEIMEARARQSRIAQVCMGIGYTAVTLDDGSIGVAYTYFDTKTGCTLVRNYQDFEDQPAETLLTLIESRDYLERSMALALINALNHANIRHFPPNNKNDLLLEVLGIVPQSKVAMVGFIKPLVKLLESMGAKVEVIDDFRGMGKKARFYRHLSNWADAALITSTAIINNTVEEILEAVAPSVKTALLGPSTPMVAQAFSPWPVIKALAGIVPLDSAAVLKTVRHGLGTPYLHRCSTKITLTL